MTSPHSALATGTVLSRGLSNGRRNRALLAMGTRQAFQTDLNNIFVPWPLPGAVGGNRDEYLAVCIALQSSPTKEAVAGLATEMLTARQKSALQLVEGAAAARWLSVRWPGLTTPLEALVGTPVNLPWVGEDTSQLVEYALRLAGRGRTPFAVPTAYGDLPAARRPPTVVQMVARQATARLPYSVERTLKKLNTLSIPVGGRGGEEAPASGAPQMKDLDTGTTSEGSGAGIPYPEWDELMGEYRRDFVTVYESRVRSDKVTRPQPQSIHDDLDAFFAEPLERRMTRRLTDGCDVDIDAVIDSQMDVMAGGTVSDQIYCDRVRVDRDVACAILIDASGSIAQAALLEREIACAVALVSAMARSGEAFAVFAFSGDTRHHVAVDVLHDFGNPTGARPDEARIQPQGYTRLGAALRHTVARLERTYATRRILLVLSDLVPCDEGYEGPYAYADIAKAVVEAEQAAVAVMFLRVGESVGDDDGGQLPAAVKDRTREVARIEDLGPALGEVHVRLVAN